MGFFKKPAAPIDNDEQIRREIRARVAKQTGIYDEEYINTGKIGGGKNVEEEEKSTPASTVSVAAVPIISDNLHGETDITFEPSKVDSVNESVAAQQNEQADSIKLDKNTKDTKPLQEKKHKPAKSDSVDRSSQRPKKKKKNIALILFIVVLLLSFIPLYNFLDSGGNQAPEITASNPDAELLLSESLLVRGIVSDSDNEDGIEVYYSLDKGSASLLYSFEATPGTFEGEIDLPDTVDFIGEHAVTIYAKDPKGKLSEAVTLNFTVVKPVLTGLTITTAPTKVKYTVGDMLDLTGLVVIAAYEGGKTGQIATYTSNIPNGTKLAQSGEIPITISYMEDNITQTAMFSITVQKAAGVTPPRTINSSYPVPSLEIFIAGPGAADLQWNALSGIDGYQIQRKTGSGGSWLTVTTLSYGYTSWTDNGPASGATYYYRICSYKVVSGVKVYSNFSTAIPISL